VLSEEGLHGQPSAVRLDLLMLLLLLLLLLHLGLLALVPAMVDRCLHRVEAPHKVDTPVRDNIQHKARVILARTHTD
jgi:hypothetical protein